MIRSFVIATAAAALLTGAATAATQCKDPKTKRFIKCPPAAATAAPAAKASTSTASNVTKDAKGRCHVASGPKKGQFTKC